MHCYGLPQHALWAEKIKVWRPSLFRCAFVLPQHPLSRHLKFNISSLLFFFFVFVFVFEIRR